jgi:hypothetical protein
MRFQRKSMFDVKSLFCANFFKRSNFTDLTQNFHFKIWRKNVKCSVFFIPYTYFMLFGSAHEEYWRRQKLGVDKILASQNVGIDKI